MNNTQYFNHSSNRLFSGARFLGLVLTLAGTLSILSPYFVPSDINTERSLITGIVFMAIGITIASKHNGTLIDFPEQKIKFFTSILGYKSGEWSNFSGVTQIILVVDKRKSFNVTNGISPTLSGIVYDYTAWLYDSNGNTTVSFTYYNKQEALNACSILSSGLNATFESRIENES